MAHGLAPQAETDLDDIWYYVAKESGSLEIADRLIDSITHRLFLLSDIPTSGAAGSKTCALACAASLSVPISSSTASKVPMS